MIEPKKHRNIISAVATGAIVYRDHDTTDDQWIESIKVYCEHHGITPPADADIVTAPNTVRLFRNAHPGPLRTAWQVTRNVWPSEEATNA